jgi:hypothetical protein
METLSRGRARRVGPNQRQAPQAAESHHARHASILRRRDGYGATSDGYCWGRAAQEDAPLQRLDCREGVAGKERV